MNDWPVGWYWIKDVFGNKYVGYMDPETNPGVYFVCGSDEAFDISDDEVFEFIKQED